MVEVKKRIVSLDAFRGITIAAMILVNYLAIAEATPTIMRHAPWNGLTIADLVFPSFLFIVGVSMAYSFASRRKESAKSLWGHFIFRVIVLFLIGIFLNWYTDGWPVRIGGVLQVIAVSSLLAAPWSRSKPKLIFLIAIIIMIVHSIILLWIPAPGITPGDLTVQGSIVGWIDNQILGEHVRYGFEPEGFMAMLSATALVLFGLLYGRLMQLKGDNWGNIKILLAGSSILVAAGLLISLILPINKQLWTSSFIMVSAGIAGFLLTLLYVYLDKWDKKSILRAGVPLGRNALVIYIFSIIFHLPLNFDAVNTSSGALSVFDIFIMNLTNYVGPLAATILWGLSVVAFWWFISYILYRKHIYIKL